MERKSISGLRLYFEAEEKEAAEMIGKACERAVPIICESWGLDVPKDCRIYVMTSWQRFVFQSAPWHWWVLLGITMPLWYSRINRMWRIAGGWTQQYGDRRAVGVKPPRLVDLSDRSLGERIFVPEKDVIEKVQHVTCHELVHAFTAHLKLPAWLNEGLAQVTVDKFAGRPTVKEDTCLLVSQSSGQASSESYRKLQRSSKDAIVDHFIRGYWLTRYLEETQLELLKRLLKQRYNHRELESKLAGAYGMEWEEFWSGQLLSRYSETI